LLERAKNEGIQLIIGPLDRDIVTELASMELKIPVLALNRTSDKSFNPNLYQFGLSPEDEINQVVEQTLDEGLKESVVIYPDSDWGKRNFAVFENSWGLRGGNIVDSASFSSQRDYSGLIKSLLNIDKSEEREKELRRITGHSFEFTPRRRKDIDFILLLANSSQARGINPTLEHFYAEDIPVYSISHIHEINASWIDTIDLDGIKFCEIPWKLSAFDNVQREIQANWSGAQGGLAAFYALGLDAYRLYPRLRQLKELPHQKLFGTTGRLTIDQSNIIRRELIWATFRDGRPTRIFF
jgi:outer membrane PBP1 activator LpoA protein